MVTEQEKDLRLKILENALKESVRLQSHYAMLLNSYDGGKRLVFRDVRVWLDRLEEISRA